LRAAFTEEEILGYISAVIRTGNPKLLVRMLSDVARAIRELPEWRDAAR
jgi:DNA-binding phage protein